MKRRDFVAVLGAAGSAWPLGVLAQTGIPGEMAPQSSNSPLVGFLNSASPVTYRFNADAFREGLAQAGFVEGRNVQIEERWANGDYSALPALAKELVAKGVVAIAATGDVRLGTRCPGRELNRSDRLHHRRRSCALPAGRELSAGLAATSRALHSCRTSSVPSACSCCISSCRKSRVGLLMNPDNPNVAAEQADSMEGAAKLGLHIVVQNARGATEIDTAFAELVRAKVDAVISATDPVLLDRREQIAALAERNALPAISFTRPLAVAGLLTSYGPDIGWMYRQAGGYIAQILKGAKPADMPVMQSSPLRARPQPQDCKALGPRGSTDVPCSCRRRDRVTWDAALWTPTCRSWPNQRRIEIGPLRQQS